jgi:hypothetical protein
MTMVEEWIDPSFLSIQSSSSRGQGGLFGWSAIRVTTRTIDSRKTNCKSRPHMASMSRLQFPTAQVAKWFARGPAAQDTQALLSSTLAQGGGLPQISVVASASTRGSCCVTRELIPSIRLCNGTATSMLDNVGPLPPVRSSSMSGLRCQIVREPVHQGLVKSPKLGVSPKKERVS